MPTVKTRIPNRERLIFAFDVAGLEEARTLIARLGDSVGFYKLGLEVFLSGHSFELMAELKGKGKKLFADLKLFDIPATVAAAVRQLALHDVDFCTVHGNGAIPGPRLATARDHVVFFVGSGPGLLGLFLFLEGRAGAQCISVALAC